MNFLKFLDSNMEVPKVFGAFHVSWLIFMVIASFVMCKFFRKIKEKHFRLILIVVSLILIVFEIYKQIIMSLEWNGDEAVWDYPKYIFPFQFCSTPMYIFLLTGLIKNKKIYQMLLSYCSIFIVFGGLIVMIFPRDVFINTIGINIQTMVFHALMVIFGIYTFAYNIKRFNFKFYLSGLLLFYIMAMIALIMNIVVYHSGVLNGETFNMFFISPYFNCTLVILGDIYASVPYIVFLLSYLLGFAFAAFIIFLIYYAIKNRKINELKVPKKEINL